MYGLSAEKNGHRREVAVSGGLTVAIINDHFFLSFHIPILWFPAAMDIILGSQKNKRWLDIDCIVIVIISLLSFSLAISLKI